MKAILAAALMAMLSCSTALAGELASPSGPAILTVTGKISETNGEGAASFDLDMLEKLEGRKARMETPWTEGRTTFEGPYLRAILEASGASGKTLRIKALNDYAADVPAEDAWKLDTILAVRMNGAAMSVRDKGPLFMIYPFDRNPEIYNEKYFSRSVWQIREIEVLD